MPVAFGLPDALRARERVHTLVGHSVSRSVGEFDGRGRGPADDYLMRGMSAGRRGGGGGM